MVDLSCDWLGLRLANPIVVGASPLCDSADDAVALVAAGAGAVVVHSLFEEQLIADQVSANRFLDSMIDTNAMSLRSSSSRRHCSRSTRPLSSITT